MKVSNLIANVQALTNQIVPDGLIVDYINSLESQVFSEVLEEYRTGWIEVSAEEDITFGAFKFEIESAEVYDKPYGNMITAINSVDINANMDIFTDLSVQGDEYSIKNKWGDCAIRVVYRYVPKEHTLETASTDDLEITRYGMQWLDLYEHYLKHKIFFAVEEYNQSNNEAVMYNEVLTRLKKYAYEHRFNRGIKDVQDRWNK